MARLHHLEARSFARWQVDRQIAERFWRDEASRPIAPDVITISREYGSGGTTVAKIVARELNLKLYDREIIEHMAELLRMGADKLEGLEEGAPRGVAEIIHGALERLPTSATYRRTLSEVVRAVAQQGNVIIVGRGAACILPHSLRVRIIAPFEVRVARVAELEGISEQEARHKVARADSERRAFARTHLRCDLSDPNLYDLIVNTERTSLEHAAELIIAAAEQRKRKGASDTQAQ